jgi:very-short-patch-repair endonuclease
MSAPNWDEVFRIIEAERERAPLVEKIRRSKGFERLDAIRSFYKLARADIVKAGRAEWGVDPYEVDWLMVFTPIENALWYDIRMAGAVLYPQYPVLNYFVDFGNPVAKVAIECDGAAFHQDTERDATRQRAIEAAGWTVYRITGRDCKTDFDEQERTAGAARQLINEVVQRHRIGRKASQ